MLKVFVVSENKKVAAGIRRALRAFGYTCEHVQNEEALQQKMQEDKTSLVVIVYQDDRYIRHWLWDVIRARHYNPVLVLGYEAVAEYKKKHQECIYEECSHLYEVIPFALSRLMECATDEVMTPVDDELALESINSRFSMESTGLFEELHGYNLKSDPDVIERVQRYFQKEGDIEAVGVAAGLLRRMRAGRWGEEGDSLLKRVLCALIAVGKKEQRNEKKDSLD